ncbi:uncharacterized protein KY384_001241 [Bacidia gigantensis]|uniref:uncharacterized protein n=1 Tax=Bacidia gigantensis TaxID=2732470 RepID=UPI001D054583|nr:uncharacterized protein KY384_001241 [Bacidia gigantensis]KAG8534396.1 hypothetical protein KY384_001241 [Bacidia gigantensis]
MKISIGSGKRTHTRQVFVVAAYIIDDLANGDSVARPVIYYYYEYEDRPTLETRSVYGTLLKQLFIDGLVPNGILDEFVEKCASDRHPPHDQYLSRLLLKVVEGISKLFVIIDGLDECDENSQQTVCDTLSLFAAIPTSAVKILVTCRNEERPLKYLQSFQKLQITPAATFEDIQRFITAEVKTKIMRQELTLRNPALELYIVDELTAKAQGMSVITPDMDLCEAASDSAIREILKNLPRGLDQTYLRIIKKIDSSMNRDLARMTLRWVAIARRPLNIEELQEAVAFDKDDRHWDEDKIPNGEKLLQACYGLVIRDEANKAHYAHHTVQQFLTSPESEEDNVQLPLSHYLCFKEDLEHMAAEVCVTYLCFSDFESALIKSEAERRVLVNDVFKHGGPIAIPAALGLRRSLIKLPIRLFGSSNFNIPQVDFAQYANPARLRKWPRPDLLKKYALLDYIVQFWPWHTNPALPSMRPFDTQETRTSRTRLPTIPENQRPSANQVQTIDRLWNLIFNKTLTFEVRPWGPNQHFGPYGCKGCPVPKDIQRPSLPFMALIHWAAGFGHFRLLMALGPDLSPHLLHEEYHQETLLIACRHGHERIVLLLLQSFDHDLGDGRAMWEACAYSQIGSLELLLRYHKSYGKHYYRPSYYVLLSKHGSERLTLLQYAAQQGSNAVFELLISQLDESYAQMDQDFGKTELRYAIKGGSVDIVNLILKSPTTLPVQDLVSYQIEYGETPLILASMLRNAPVVRALLAAGAPTERTSTRFLDVPVQVQKWVHGGMLPAYDSRSNPSPDYKGAAAIHFAIHENNADVLQLLPNIEQSCKCVVRLAGREDYSLEYIELRPLHLAAAYGRTECAEVLLAKGANIDVPCDDVGMTPLHFAAMRSGRELVEALLRYDADSLADDRFGHKPLGYAISSGNASILALLLGKLKDEQRLSAMLEQDSGLLCSAVMWNHIEAVKLLSQELANPKITDSRTVAWEIRRSLSDAISSPHVKDDIIRVLVGVQPEILTHNHKIDDHGDETFLDRAVLSQNEARVKLLLELGAGDRYPTVGTYLQSMVPIALSLAIDNVSPACCSVLLTSKMYKPLSYVRKNAYDYAKTLYQERKLASRFKGKADQRRILELLKEGVEHDWDHI